MLRMGIEKVRESGYKGITVEGNYNFHFNGLYAKSKDGNLYQNYRPNMSCVT